MFSWSWSVQATNTAYVLERVSWSFTIAAAPCLYALKLEISVGAYKCKNCGYFSYDKKLCMLRNQYMDDYDYCSLHKSELELCDNCHQIIVDKPLVWTREDGKTIVLCKNCFKRL